MHWDHRRSSIPMRCASFHLIIHRPQSLGLTDRQSVNFDLTPICCVLEACSVLACCLLPNEHWIKSAATAWGRHNKCSHSFQYTDVSRNHRMLHIYLESVSSFLISKKKIYFRSAAENFHVEAPLLTNGGGLYICFREPTSTKVQ